ncbi:hypothetical protein K7X08_019066 [Anisodus acutangulus]|uniref:Uncharacterized protein n=1 Tax=Anisodus acutangulus TaxID=402998 RepID=A0A9Q1M1P4_9SOLA|nr:hypothetical protein K7X08_019066 [Anisodus acutangulus]
MKWGDDCVEEEAESDEEGYAQITMDFREPRSPVGSIDSDTPIVRLDANILHPRALRMLGFNTKEGLEFEGMTEALTTMFKDPADYVLEAPRARTVLKLPERPQEVHSQVSSASSFTTGDTVSVHSPAATVYRQIEKVSTPTYNALELEDNEGVQEGEIREATLKVATVTPVVTTKQWVANSFEGNNVPMNKECAEIPSNTSSERNRWSDEVEDVVEEGEILISEESTNSSSPDDPGEEEAGKENNMASVITPEEVDVQEEKQLEDNNAVEAQPMEAENTAEASQIQGQKPEENMHAEKPTVREEDLSSKQKSVSKPKKQGANDQAISQPPRIRPKRNLGTKSSN